MKNVGSLLFLFGAGSIVLFFLDYEFRILNWIETWGPEIAWAIRLTMVVVGAILWIVGNKEHIAEV